MECVGGRQGHGDSEAVEGTGAAELGHRPWGGQAASTRRRVSRASKAVRGEHLRPGGGGGGWGEARELERPRALHVPAGPGSSRVAGGGRGPRAPCRLTFRGDGIALGAFDLI